MVVIDSMFVYQFVDSDLIVEIFSKKEVTAENGRVDFETGNIGFSAELDWRLNVEGFM